MNQREWGKCVNCGANFKRRREQRMMLCVPCTRIRFRDPELFDNALRRKRRLKSAWKRVENIRGHWAR